jgi:nucleoside-diphosphate-sugar epimerase
MLNWAETGDKAKVFVTGATGFVGRFLCERLLIAGYSVRGTLLPSENPSTLLPGVNPIVVQTLGPNTDWLTALEGTNIIIHLAARVHNMADHTASPLTEFHKVNTEGTRRLAQEAVRAGVKRLLFVSSIKVNGEESGTPYTKISSANPTDAYGSSKWEAEQILRKIEAETGLEVIVVRPTLVYGPGVKANFLNMMKAVQRGVPLPLASTSNKRSLIYVENLVDALAACATRPEAAGQTYLVSDGEDVSTAELICRTASALGVSARLFPFPVPLMKLVGKITGKIAEVNRLTGSLTVDSSKIRKELGWKPPFTMEEGLRLTAEWFKNNKE